MKFPPLLLKIVRIITLSATGFLLLMGFLLLGCQRRLIYFPRKYNVGAIREAERAGFVTLRYPTSAGNQLAFYLPPRESPELPASRLWVLTGGNASQALDWTDVALKYPDRRAAFLLIDYPGYGDNEGRPSRASIVESSQKALAAWQAHVQTHPQPDANASGSSSPQPPLGVMGHSLGAAAALELACRAQSDRIVLISPFTSLMDMARLSVGRGFAWLLLDRFDNAERLKELAARNPRPTVTILHGTEDDIIPYAMGEQLAQAHPDWIAFVPLQNGDHNMVLNYFDDEIIAAMQRDSSAP